ncbi:hypothetical protein SLS53_004098 [Cytospora paraplurivora]|uniref:Acyltransferase 3 domain-containing protein n=1 Tax=Cytospora paraplurivora TaxID=2898453 RepID=A0AAN9U9R5_9PEZI
MTIFQTLLPSFIADILWPDHKSPLQAHRLHPTSYLDGLRGVASLLVFFCHYTEENHPYLVPSYGLNKDGMSSWLQLPLVRILYSGRPMVHIFFVISGFVLSYKPLKAIRARDLDTCYTALSSSTFRRPFRLFGPTLVSTAMIGVLIQAGFMYRPLPTAWDQFMAWIDAMFHSITWPWAWDTDLRPAFDIHLWSIPIEFAHSMLLFMTILMVARVRPNVRHSVELCLIAYAVTCGKWAAFEFWSGMLLADIHIKRLSQMKRYESIDSISPHSPGTLPRSIENAFLHYCVHGMIFLGCIFTAGWPNFDAYKTPGIQWLLAHTPSSFPQADNLTPQKFWFSVQAVAMVWTCGELHFVKEFLEGGFAQYCGHISYAIYIVHGPVLELLQSKISGTLYTPPKGTPGLPGYRVEVLPSGIKGTVGVDTALQRTVSWALGLLFLGPMVVWAADVFWRLVDIPMIHLARNLEARVLDTGVDLGARPTNGEAH